MKNIKIVLATIITIVIFSVLVVYGVGSFKRGTADFRGETEQIEKTKADANYRIASYEKFYDTCSSVQSLESKIRNLKDELKGEISEQRESVLNTSVTAAKNKRAELINKYNSDARKEATQGQFKASDLPYKLNEDEEKTICEAY